MPSLRDQLRDHARALEAASSPSTPEMARHAAPVVAPSGRRGRRRVPARGLLAAAVVLVAILVGALVWLPRSDEGEDDLATSEHAAGAIDDADAWTHVPDAFETESPAVVASDGAQLLAVGQVPCVLDCSRDLLSNSVVRSRDGRDWEQVTEVLAPDTTLIDLTYDAGWWSAIEVTAPPDPEDRASVGTASSEDGERWDSSTLAADSTATGIAARDGRVVMSGSVYGTRPVVWTGTDLTTPLKLIDLGPVPGAQGVTALTTVPPIAGIEGLTEVTAVTATADGFVAAADGPDRDPVLLDSVDGLTWSIREGTNPPGRVRDLLAHGDRIVALVGDVDTVVWRYDGSAWNALSDPIDGTGTSDLALVGDAVVAVVAGDDPSEPSHIGVSRDLRSWTWLSDELVPDGSRPSSVTAHGDGVVVVGQGDAWLWYPADGQRPSGTLDPLPPAPAIGELDWEQLPDPGPEDRPDDVAMMGGIAVAEWTGEELFALGGRDPATGDLIPLTGQVWRRGSDRWQPLPSAPLSPREHVRHTWTGDELLVWGGVRDPSIGEVPIDPSDADGPDPERFADGAAYDPDDDEWRDLPEPPLDGGEGYASVWTGDEWVLWGGPLGMRPWDDPALAAAGFEGQYGLLSQQGAAYDPEDDEWRELPPAPVDLLDADAGWNGREVVVWGARYGAEPSAEPHDIAVAAYDPAADDWRELPTPAIAPDADGVLTGAGFLLVADETTLLWDDEADEWLLLPPPPTFSCGGEPTSLVPFDDTALLAASCSADAAVFDRDARSWRSIVNTPRDQSRAWGSPGAPSAIVHAGRWEDQALWIVEP